MLFEAIDLAEAGDQVVVPGTIGFGVRVRKWFVKAGAAGLTVQWKDESGVALTGPLSLAAFDGVGESELAGGLMETTKGAGLVLSLSDPHEVGGKVVFEYVN